MTLSPASPDPAPVDSAREIERLALKLLASREHSRHELQRKIQARGFGVEEIEEVLDALQREGALDERRFAERYVSERAEKGFGPTRIRAELRERGLADDLIGRYLDPMEGAWPGYLAQAHRRRFHAEPPVDRSDYARQARFLEQRGFPADAIRRFLRFND